MFGIRRRDFVALLGSAAVAWPLAARAQQSAMPVIGFWGRPRRRPGRHGPAAFVQRLRELGWIEGRTATIEYRWAESRPERFVEIAAEFGPAQGRCHLHGWSPKHPRGKTGDIGRSDRLCACETTLSAAAWLQAWRDRAATSPVCRRRGPIPWESGSDSWASLSRLRRWAVMLNAGFPDAVMELSEMQAAAKLLGLELTVLEYPARRRYHALLRRNQRARRRPLCLRRPARARQPGPHQHLALDTRLPTMHGFREYAAAGGLVSYGPNVPDLFRRSADFVNRFSRGEARRHPSRAADQVRFGHQPQTAKALGLDVPPTLLARADEVIE